MHTLANNTNKLHKSYYDIVRLLAIFLVIFNHTPAFHYPFQTHGNDLNVQLMLLVSVIVKMAVPLFFMISGGLLLNKEENIQTIFTKRILRFVFVIIIFHLIQFSFYFVCFHSQGSDIGVASFIESIYTKRSYPISRTNALAVWFLYAYLGFLLLLPLLRVMVQNMKNEHFLYLACLQITFSVLLPSSYIIGMGKASDTFALAEYLPLCNNVFLYIIAGYYIEHRLDVNQLKRRHFCVLTAISLLSIVAACAAPEIARQRTNASILTQYTPGIIQFLLIPCCTLMLSLKKALNKTTLPERWIRVLKYAGGAVFCVMIIENILRKLFAILLFDNYYSTYMPSIWVTCIVWIVGILIGCIVKKLPLIGKLF